MWLLDKCTIKGKSMATLTLTQTKNSRNDWAVSKPRRLLVSGMSKDQA